jgi:hypothetical protein
VLLPQSRGLASETVFTRLTGSVVHHLPRVQVPDDPWSEDFQILLWVLQQMAFRPFDRVDPAWEVHGDVRALRDQMEMAYEAQLRNRVVTKRRADESIADAMRRLTDGADGPSLSEWMEDNASLDHLREFVIHRASYQLQEADPHSFAIPRLAAGRAKRALLKIQFDEYGNAEPNESHAELFRQTMDVLAVDLDLDALPASTLRTNTLLNMFANSRRLLGACLGHLAVFETCSVGPMSRYAAAVRRLLPDDDIAAKAARFYDVHVAADGWHQELAITEMVDGFVEQYPSEADEVVFGAGALMLLERELSDALLTAWSQGRSSLRHREERAA